MLKLLDMFKLKERKVNKVALSVETKRINDMQSLTEIANGDNIIIELANGGTRKMTYAALLQSLGMESVQVAVREQRCINEGIDGIEWDLDELMTLVRNGEFNKFAIGDSFVDGTVHWRIHGKKTFSKWQVDETTLGEIPNTITCLPDESLGQVSYNLSKTNSGGYAGSRMPNYLENTVLPTLSENLRSYIKETKINENNKGSMAAVMRKMRIPTVIECTGNQGFADQYSGGICSQLPLMRATRHRIKDYYYWCLDPSASNTTKFCNIGNTGGNFDNDAFGSPAFVRPEIVLG